jgi:hypothetical protein
MTDHTQAIEAGLAINSNHRVYEWSNNGYTVYFSATSHGDAMAIHLAANSDSRRCLRLAVNEFCEYIFDQYKWCDVILGAIVSASVVNLAKKCGFTYVADVEIHTGDIAAVYSRKR